MKHWTDDDPETGFFPVFCSWCKSEIIGWSPVKHSHGICGPCSVRARTTLAPRNDQADPLRELARRKFGK